MCERVLVNGTWAIVCGGRGTHKRPRKCGSCLKPSAFQCDWKIGPGKTCDRFICSEHAEQVAKDKHLCPEHQEAYKEWKARRASG